MTNLLSTDTFKIALIGSFVTVIFLAICGTVITLNEPTVQQVQSTNVAK